ncbi:uncharacterized protein LOC128337176 isoform X2 [Hemicordylus capensis]|uniref:uncharacterized protein LOC128337176 isoform X2 n=1 Tax=Hemicordylus capensis TaxID=884348 RepID=UPI0023041E7B|nr:uncharacterized protein LOC128337176 isoform X2 [Hemicordylus capensis]
MLFHFAGMMLLSLHSAESQRSVQVPQELREILAFPGKNVTISCSLPSGQQERQVVTWYLEQQDQRLHRIFLSASYTHSDGKYSSPSSTDFSLVISHLQKNDSGVYYCAAPIYGKFEILNRSRLIVVDPSQTQLFMLVPSSSLERAQLNHSFPLLCLLWDANPSWKSISWEPSRETSPDPMDVGTLDENGVFSVWSLQLFPPAAWTQGIGPGCSVQADKNISAVFQRRHTKRVPSTGKCSTLLYVGVPSIAILLLIPPFLFLFRKRLAKGKAERSARQVLMGQILQTDYAEVCSNNRNVLQMD